MKELSQLSILYVDDDDLMRFSLPRVLGKHVKEITVAENGLQGLELFEKCRHDAVITDLEMPVLNGVEFMKRLREYYGDVPIIVLTAFEDQAELAKDADVVLAKPLLIKKVVAALGECAKK
ncbi:response regulator [Limisalsivibrio acetivorans]|uniref:response regulator n=1 Tax=Limisalsivibrio acetivorans TaxID=1304888 RepID=UPI0003B69DF9|nr:response regulator [Limisalsivibrio acetivorans]